MTKPLTEIRTHELLAERVLRSDEAATDLGIGALKAAILANSGALVAFIAIIGQAIDQKNSTLALALVKGSWMFVVGLVLAMGAFAVAYFYQSMVTRLFDDELHGKDFTVVWSKNNPLYKLTRRFAWSMVGLTIASFLAFICGAVITYLEMTDLL